MESTGLCVSSLPLHEDQDQRTIAVSHVVRGSIKSRSWPVVHTILTPGIAFLSRKLNYKNHKLFQNHILGHQAYDDQQLLTSCSNSNNTPVLKNTILSLL